MAISEGDQTGNGVDGATPKARRLFTPMEQTVRMLLGQKTPFEEIVRLTKGDPVEVWAAIDHVQELKKPREASTGKVYDVLTYLLPETTTPPKNSKASHIRSQEVPVDLNIQSPGDISEGIILKPSANGHRNGATPIYPTSGNRAHSVIKDSPERAAALDEVNQRNAQRANEALQPRETLHPAAKMLFLGIAMGGDYQTFEGQFSNKKKAIGLRCRTSDNSTKQLFEVMGMTQGSEFTDIAKGLTVRLQYEQYKFLLNPNIQAGSLDISTRYAPFALGLMASTMSEVEQRIYLKDTKLLSVLFDKFYEHFGFDIGKMAEEKSHGRVSKVLYVKNTEKVVKKLSVAARKAKMPFVDEISAILLPPGNSTSVEAN